MTKMILSCIRYSVSKKMMCLVLNKNVRKIFKDIEYIRTFILFNGRLHIGSDKGTIIGEPDEGLIIDDDYLSFYKSVINNNEKVSVKMIQLIYYNPCMVYVFGRVVGMYPLRPIPALELSGTSNIGGFTVSGVPFITPFVFLSGRKNMYKNIGRLKIVKGLSTVSIQDKVIWTIIHEMIHGTRISNEYVVENLTARIVNGYSKCVTETGGLVRDAHRLSLRLVDELSNKLRYYFEGMGDFRYVVIDDDKVLIVPENRDEHLIVNVPLNDMGFSVVNGSPIPPGIVEPKEIDINDTSIDPLIPW